MNIVPTRIQEHINRVERTPSLAIGISAGLTALWSLYRVFWLIYTATVLSNVGWSPVSLVFPFVLWTVIGVVAAIAAVAFMTRYAKRTRRDSQRASSARPPRDRPRQARYPRCVAKAPTMAVTHQTAIAA